MLRKLVELPAGGLRQTNLVEQRRAQARGYAAQGIDRAGDENLHVHHLLVQRRRQFLDPARQPIQIHAQPQQLLAEFVMQLAGDLGALFLAHVL